MGFQNSAGMIGNLYWGQMDRNSIPQLDSESINAKRCEKRFPCHMDLLKTFLSNYALNFHFSLASMGKRMLDFVWLDNRCSFCQRTSSTSCWMLSLTTSSCKWISTTRMTRFRQGAEMPKNSLNSPPLERQAC